MVALSSPFYKKPCPYGATEHKCGDGIFRVADCMRTVENRLPPDSTGKEWEPAQTQRPREQPSITSSKEWPGEGEGTCFLG